MHRRFRRPVTAVVVAVDAATAAATRALPCLSLSLSIAATYSLLHPPVFAAGSRRPVTAVVVAVAPLVLKAN
jgi:hypothetical protein